MPQRPPRGIKYNGHAQAALADGINLVARVVSGTFGPHARVVMLDSRFGTPEISVSAMDSKAGTPVVGNDGYAIAREILTANTYQNQGVFLARDAGKMAKRGTGDGSTTAILLTDAMVQGGLRMVQAGFEPVGVARGMQAAAEEVCRRLAESTTTITSREQLEIVGRQAAGGDAAVGRTIAEGVHRVGSENVMLEEGGHSSEVDLEVDESFSIARGYLDPNLIPNRGGVEAVLDQALVFVSSADVDDMRAFSRVLEVCSAAGRPLLAVSTGFGSDVLALITVNLLNKRATCVPVVAPGHGVGRGEILEDAAVFTGATVVDEAGLRAFGKGHAGALGSAGEVVVGRATTTIREGGSDPEKLRLRLAALAVAARDADSLHERDELEARRSRLAGRGHGIVRIGAPTDVERRERFRRATDALQAIRRALEGGVVAGGGAALLRAGRDLRSLAHAGDDEAAGIDVVRRATERPARTLAANGGWDAGEAVARLRDATDDLAFDVARGQFASGIGAGIVDPTEVVSRALMVATSSAVTVLKSRVVIAQPLNGGRYAGTVAEGGPANLALS